MNKIFIFFLLAFSTKLNCEQRGTYFSELDKKENKYPLAISYDDVATVLWCGVKCLNDNCCAQFLYDKITKHCIGVHNFEKGFISFSQISGLSDKTELYRKGNNKTLIGMIYSQKEINLTYNTGIYLSTLNLCLKNCDLLTNNL